MIKVVKKVNDDKYFDTEGVDNTYIVQVSDYARYCSFDYNSRASLRL
jgi:hypothetical protein